MRILLFFIIIKVLFCFSEGKPCPEKYRPHKTRCDAYFKCVVLPSKSHVWMPAKCDRGLIFEPGLKMCVLPGEDWECNLGENKPLKSINDDNNIYGVNLFNITPDAPTQPSKLKIKPNGESVKIIEFIELDNNSNRKHDDDEDLTFIAGSETQNNIIDDDIESSGDDQLSNMLEKNTNSKLRENFDEMELPEPQNSSKVDPKLASQLQRLSQLIEGLQNTYKRKDTNNTKNELRPDQLNAFLAHFNIKNEYDSFDPNDENMKIESIKNDDTKNKIEPNNESMNDHKIKNSTKVIPKKQTNNSKTTKVVALNPETKVILKNSGYRNNYFNPEKSGYSNSQIVVNRPEGSVVFSLGNQHKLQNEDVKFNNVMKHNPYDYNSEPKISEETLKTVLELSKQMISNQNIRQVLPANMAGVYQPFMSPVYYGPMPYNQHPYVQQNAQQMNYNNNPNSNNYNTNDQDNIDEGYNKFTSTAYISNDKKNNRNKPAASTTVIQNSVIPVHITTNSDKGIIDRPGSETPTSSSAENYSFENMFDEDSENLSFNNIKKSQNNNKNIIQLFGMSSSTTPQPQITMITTKSPQRYPPSVSSNNLSYLNYHTPNPHLDDSNANSIFQSTDEDRYPILSSNYDQFGQNNPQNYLRPSTNNHKQNQFASQYTGANNIYDRNDKDSYVYQSKIKIPSLSSLNQQKLQQLKQKQKQQQQQQYLLSMGLTDDNNFDINQNSNELEQSIEYAGNTDLLSETPSNYQNQNSYISNSLSNHFNIKKQPQFVTNQLTHQNLDQQYSFLNNNNNINNKIQTGPTTSPSNSFYNSDNINDGTSVSNMNTLVNFGGSFISYDVYKNKILPALGFDSPNTNNIFGSNNRISNNQPNVEIVTCAPGIRQPNSTDCTKYFVCSRKDSKVLSYSCPPYTAFNSESRICDAKTYAVCNPQVLFNPLSINVNNRKLHLDALKVLQDAKRIRDETIKAQSMSNFIRYQNEQKYNQSLHQPSAAQNAFLNPTVLTNLLHHFNSIETPTDTDENMASNNNMMMMQSMMHHTSTTTTSTIRPLLNLQKKKKRKYYCREGDKIPDQTSNSNYFVCYKTKDGAMHGHKMSCSAGLVFCATTKLCTMLKNCNS